MEFIELGNTGRRPGLGMWEDHEFRFAYVDLGVPLRNASGVREIFRYVGGELNKVWLEIYYWRRSPGTDPEMRHRV